MTSLIHKNFLSLNGAQLLIQTFFKSHNNPCFQCNIAIRNGLLSWRHRSKHCTYVFLRKNSKTSLTYMAKRVCFGALFFSLIRWIQLRDTQNLTFVDCCDEILLNSSWKKKNVIKLCKGSLNAFPNNPWFFRVCRTSLLKTLWEKKKLLVTSNFFFSHSVFYPFRGLSAIFSKIGIVVCKLFQFGRVWNLSFWKGLITFLKIR